MPIFDYQCQTCGECFEFLQMNPSDQVTCPKCNGTDITKQVSLFTCTEIQLNKRLTLKAKDDMRDGMKMLKGQRMRKKRIKIL